MDKKIISFASDFGLSDGSVGIVKGVINRIDPEIKIIDVSHDIKPHNVGSGSLLLMRAIQYLPNGVLLGVVDPGVGTDRKAVALETEWGYMVGPDNGLLNLAAATVGGVTRAFELTNKEWIIPSEGSTFEARDKFGPFAAALASNTLPIEKVGPETDVELLQNLLIPLTEKKGNIIEGEAIWNDHYGNSQTNIDPADLNEVGISHNSLIKLTIGETSHQVKWSRNYAEIDEGKVGLVTDSWGMIAICMKNSSASTSAEISEGTKIHLSLDDSSKDE